MARGLKATPDPFAYPSLRHVRKHGPYGYADYESFRQWLRDEFSFRCVFCLRREQWNVVRGSWHIDHYVPQVVDASAKLVYENLLYACSTCNAGKGSAILPDPCKVAYGKCLKVNNDGTIVALDKDGEILIDVLRLDNDDYTQYRGLMINTLQSLAKHDRKIFNMWMRYPKDLPNLRRQKPVGNSKPEGLKDSFFELRARGELTATY